MKHDSHEYNKLDARLRGRSCCSKCNSVSWRDKHTMYDLHTSWQSRILWSTKDFALSNHTQQNPLEDLSWPYSFTCSMDNQTKRSGDFRAGCPRCLWICMKIENILRIQSSSNQKWYICESVFGTLTIAAVYVRAANLVHQQHEDKSQHQRDTDEGMELLMTVRMFVTRSYHRLCSFLIRRGHLGLTVSVVSCCTESNKKTVTICF